MKILFNSLFILLVSISKLNAQSAAGIIQVEDHFPRDYYIFKEQNLGFKQVAVIIREDKQAYRVLKPAKVYYAMGNSLMLLGATMILVPLGKIVQGESNNLGSTFIGVGAGLMLFSIPMYRIADKQASKAITLYNDGLSGSFKEQRKSEFYLGTTGSGIGLTMKF